MKRKSLLLLTAVLSVLIYLSGCSDKVYVNRALTWAESGVRLDTALEAVNHATELEETKDWAKTYYVRGYVYQKIYETKDEEFKKLAEKPLPKAFDNYKKAYNMEGGEAYHGSIDAAMFTLHRYFIQDGVDAFKKNNYDDAFQNFKYAINVTEMPVFENRVDTAIIFNAGIAAQQMGNWEEAIEYYRMASKYGYQGSRTYILLNNAYKQIGDTAQSVEVLKEGFEKYPSNQQMIASLVNYYLLDSGHPEKALKYLEEGIKQDPDNPQYYFAKGRVYDQMGEPENAIEGYKKAIELDSDMFLALYNLGVLYYNQGVDLEAKANKTKDEEKYKELKRQAEDKFEKALPYMENAHKVKPEDMSVMSTLKTLYYRLRVKGQEYMDKYEQISKKIERMKKDN